MAWKISNTDINYRNYFDTLSEVFSRIRPSRYSGSQGFGDSNQKIFHLKENTKNYQSIAQARKIQWQIYKRAYQQLSLILDRITVETKDDVRSIYLSDLGTSYFEKNIAEEVLVPEHTQLAVISCVDEGTQGGEFINETDVNKNSLGTISDPNSDRYFLDIAGAGALKYVCKKTSDTNITIEEVLEIEDGRLDDLAHRLVTWCKNKNILKLTVTYHCGCGAVGLRKKSLSSLYEDKPDIEIAKECAFKTAKKVEQVSKQIGYNLNVTVAFIGDKQMCKLRPMVMHNALGTLGCLDSRILGKKMDQTTNLNFFDVLIHSEFEEGSLNTPFAIDTIESAVKNLILTTKIAFGEHGWGENYFSKDRPYFILMMCNGSSQELQARDIINQIKKEEGEEYINCLNFFTIRTDL